MEEVITDTKEEVKKENEKFEIKFIFCHSNNLLYEIKDLIRKWVVYDRSLITKEDCGPLYGELLRTDFVSLSETPQEYKQKYEFDRTGYGEAITFFGYPSYTPRLFTRWQIILLLNELTNYIINGLPQNCRNDLFIIEVKYGNKSVKMNEFASSCLLPDCDLPMVLRK